MTEYRDAGLVTDDPVIAAIFLGKDILVGTLTDVTYDLSLSYPIFRYWRSSYDLSCAYMEQHDIEVTIPWPAVWAAIQPVEGEGYVFDMPWSAGLAHLEIEGRYIGVPAKGAYHKRVLNIVTSRAELRELVGRCRREI